eukprot:289038-Pyramimonas_sp.AAC.1
MFPTLRPSIRANRKGDARHAEDSATRDRPAEAHSSIDGAKVAPAEEVVPDQDGDDDTVDIPGANPTTQSDEDHSSEDSPMLEGDDDITSIIQALRDVSNEHFSRPRASSAFKNEKPLFYRLRGLRARAQEVEQPETPELKKFRIKAASIIQAARCVYSIYAQNDEHEPDTYSAVKAEPNFVRTPVVSEKPRRSRRAEAGGSGVSMVRVPTPPASTRADQDDQFDAHVQPSVSPTVEPWDEGTTYAPQSISKAPGCLRQSGNPGSRH